MTFIHDIFYDEKLNVDTILEIITNNSINIQFEIFKILEKMYYRSKTTWVKEILYGMIVNTNLSSELRIQVALLFENTLPNDVFLFVLSILNTTDINIVLCYDCIKKFIPSYPSHSNSLIKIFTTLSCSL